MGKSAFRPPLRVNQKLNLPINSLRKWISCLRTALDVGWMGKKVLFYIFLLRAPECAEKSINFSVRTRATGTSPSFHDNQISNIFYASSFSVMKSSSPHRVLLSIREVHLNQLGKILLQIVFHNSQNGWEGSPAKGKNSNLCQTKK
jgi:hypothetical protein